MNRAGGREPERTRSSGRIVVEPVVDLSTLAAEEAEAAQRLAQARAAVQRARVEAAERKRQAQVEHDRRLVEEYRTERVTLAAEAEAAAEAFRAAVLADPLFAAYRAQRVAEHRARLRAYEHGSAVMRLTGREWNSADAPRIREFSLVEVVALVDRDARPTK